MIKPEEQSGIWELTKTIKTWCSLIPTSADVRAHQQCNHVTLRILFINTD